jgi:transglutaminase-like putative cysteine protease
MNKFQCIAILFFLGSLFGCDQGDHFISDKTYRGKVNIQFEKQKKLAENRKVELFKVFDQDISGREKEALRFLYAYMPLSDLADYDGDFYLKNVRASFAAKDTFTWGKQVPENFFRHFVLPVRVNNENLDTSRWVFFMELKNRIRHLSMKDAALEVNHWCHEKVTYKGSDERTSSPLATVKNAYGRCGEESTFTVAALRAVCIPARQCYTPRWAHSDDNHAWVEVWVDGKWHYMGACEPEPELDLAWFTGPAKRAMLVNTNVFGDYNGPEEVLVKDQRFTRINVLSNYTDTKKIFVKITGQKNSPVDSAIVEFQLYNYAEFYPLQRCYTDKNGLCSFITGYGDMLVWAAKGTRFGYRKVSVAGTDTITLALNRIPGEAYTEVFDFVPPPEKKVESNISDSLRNFNTKRFAFEDRIRAAYENTFIDSIKSHRLAANFRMDPDSLWMILHKCRGNWRDLIEFIASVPSGKKQGIIPLLNEISEKDLHDVTIEVLNDNILFTRTYEPMTKNKAIFSDYILSPRVDNEYLKPFREFFQEKFDKDFILKGRKDAEAIVKWIASSIRIDDKANYAKAPLTPRGVYELKVADTHSRDIFFVAVCRSFGIPARLELSTRIPQYLSNEKWHDVYFTNAPSKTNARGILVVNNDRGNDRVPEYYIHFTIERYEDGFFRSLDYETDPVLKSFPFTIEVPPGSYMMVTGNRISGGTVLTKLSFFSVEENKTQNLDLALRKEPVQTQVYGKISNMDGFLKKVAGERIVNNYGVILAWLDPEKEPSRHFIADLLQKKTDLEKWKGSIVLLFNTATEKDLFLKKNAAGLPFRIKCSVASPGSLQEMVKTLQKKTGIEIPVVTFISPGGKVRFFSEGYKIGIGDEILKYLNPVK